MGDVIANERFIRTTKQARRRLRAKFARRRPSADLTRPGKVVDLAAARARRG